MKDMVAINDEMGKVFGLKGGDLRGHTVYLAQATDGMQILLSIKGGCTKAKKIKQLLKKNMNGEVS